MSRPSRSSKRGKGDAVPESPELVTPESPLLSATTEMRTMPPQTAFILWILIILAVIVPAVASMRPLSPPPRCEVVSFKAVAVPCNVTV
jgi:hypothetical protein